MVIGHFEIPVAGEVLTVSLIQTFLTSLQQTTFENIVTIEEIAHDEQFLLLPLCFQLYSIIKLTKNFHMFDLMFSKSFVVCGKGLRKR